MRLPGVGLIVTVIMIALAPSRGYAQHQGGRICNPTLSSLRGGPGSGYPEMKNLPFATFVLLLERQGNWLKVAVQEGENSLLVGFIAKDAFCPEGWP